MLVKVPSKETKAVVVALREHVLTVLPTAQQIAFPMARNRSIFRLRRPSADGNHIDDLPAGTLTAVTQ
jgi:hypothetical protein